MPDRGEPITYVNGALRMPSHPIIPFITEELWQKIAPLTTADGALPAPSLMIAAYPRARSERLDEQAEHDVAEPVHRDRRLVVVFVRILDDPGLEDRVRRLVELMNGQITIENFPTGGSRVNPEMQMRPGTSARTSAPTY